MYSLLSFFILLLPKLLLTMQEFLKVCKNNKNSKYGFQAVVFYYFCISMKNRICIILYLLTLTGFLLFFVQEKWHPFKLKPLEGVIRETPFPEFTMDNYVSGSLQRDLEQYSSENFGFREWVIRLYNQYLWTFYHKTYCHFIVPGKNGYLFYSEALSDYYGIESIKMYRSYDRARQWARQNVRMMNKLRYVLQDYSVEFLCFMAPNKVQLYSEYLPYHKPAPADAINTADYYDSLMTAIGFPHIEMTRWFQQIKDTASFQLIPKRDTHWRYAAVYGYDSLFSYMNSLNDFGIPDIKVYGMRQLDTMYRENDEKTLNLIFPIPNDAPKYRPEVSVECGEGCRKPKVLFVGDSFIWDLETYLPWKEILDDVEIWFYNSSAFLGFEKEKHPVSELNRLRSILRADYVVWYSTGSQWCRSSYDFVENALLDLCVTDSLFDAQIPWVMDSLRHDSAFVNYHYQWQYSEHYEDSLRYYAVKVLKDNPELIPGLDGDDMPTIRNTEAIALAQEANRIVTDKQWQAALRITASQSNRPFDEVLDEEAENVVLGRALLRDAVQVDTAVMIQMEIEKLINRWRNDPQTIQFLENKAQEKGKTFETVLEEDARWVVNERLRNGELF